VEINLHTNGLIFELLVVTKTFDHGKNKGRKRKKGLKKKKKGEG